MNLIFLLFSLSLAMPLWTPKFLSRPSSESLDATLAHLNQGLPPEYQRNPTNFESVLHLESPKMLDFKRFEIEKMLYVVQKSPEDKVGILARDQAAAAKIMELRMKNLAKTAKGDQKAVYKDLQEFFGTKKQRYLATAGAFLGQ